MKNICYIMLLTIISAIITACPAEPDNGNNNNNTGNTGNTGNNGDNGNNIEVKTGAVTFFNESIYNIVVHQDAFSGPVLLELSSWGSKKVDVRTSDNYGVGSTFSIEYLYRVNDDFDTESGEVIASGIDPNVQINLVIEENKSHNVNIPQPQNLEFRTAFIRIINAASLPCELRYLGTVFKQTGNNNIPVAPGKTGVYKLDGIPTTGKLYQNYELVSTFASAAIPDFTAVNGIIYSFEYNGTSVIKTGEQTIIYK